MKHSSCCMRVRIIEQNFLLRIVVISRKRKNMIFRGITDATAKDNLLDGER